MIKGRLLAGLALLLVLGAGAAYYLGLFGAGNSAALQDPDAKQRFLSERGGALSGPIHGPVERIDGETLTVTTMVDGSSVDLQLSAETEVFKQTTLQLTDLKPGDKVSVSAWRDEEQLTATAIQVGDLQLPGQQADSSAKPGAFVFRNDGEAPAGSPPVTIVPAGGGDGQDVPVPPAGEGGQPNESLRVDPSDSGQGQFSTLAFENIAGIVERLENDTLVIKQDDGKTVSVTLGASVSISRRDRALAGEITVGQHILASGARTDDLIKADVVELISGQMMQINNSSAPTSAP